MTRLISSEELMRILGLNKPQLDALRRKGLRGVKVGQGKWIFVVDDVVAFFKEQAGRPETSETIEK